MRRRLCRNFDCNFFRNVQERYQWIRENRRQIAVELGSERVKNWVEKKPLPTAKYLCTDACTSVNAVLVKYVVLVLSTRPIRFRRPARVLASLVSRNENALWNRYPLVPFAQARNVNVARMFPTPDLTAPTDLVQRQTNVGDPSDL